MNVCQENPDGLLDGLDEAQRLAASAPPEPLVVAAGAGSGKTRMLTHRVAYLAGTGAIDPSRTVVTTFTAAAAGELGERLSPLMGSDFDRMRVQTMHAWMWAIINKWRDQQNLPGLVVAEISQTKYLLRRLLGRPDRDYPEAINAFDIDMSIVTSELSRWKALLIGPDDPAVKNQVRDPIPDLAAAAMIYPLYEARLARENRIDFDGMLVEGHRILSTDPDTLAAVQRRAEALFCDEGQDTNHAQWEILNLVAPPSARPCLTLVGDARQSVYQWRNAMPDRFLAAPAHWNAQSMQLTNNYRSVPEVVNVANLVIGPVGLPDMVPSRSEPGTVTTWEAGDPREEADIVALWARTHIDDGTLGSDLAVLARTNAQSAPIERALFQAGVPYFCTGGSFFNRGPVRILLAYLRLTVDPTDTKALSTIINKPTRFLGDKYVHSVSRAAGRSGNLIRAMTRVHAYESNKRMLPKQIESARNLVGLLDDIKKAGPGPALLTVLNRTDFVRWYRSFEGSSQGADDTSTENIDALVALAGEFRTIERFLRHADEVEANMQHGENAVRVSTIHRAKGQEWSHVTVIGVGDGTLPHYRAVAAGFEDEERRLAYVATTRAKDTLTLIYPQVTGRGDDQAPSPFLDDMGVTAVPHPPIDRALIEVKRPDWLVEGLSDDECGEIPGQRALFGA